MTSISFWCFFELIKKETLAFFKNFSNDFIDCVIATTTWVGVFAYLMKGTGINESYGFFILIGSFAGNGLYISAGYCFILAQKINNKQISNYLNLPVNSFFYFISFSISTAIKVFIMEISILPIGKLLLWNKFNLANFCFIKFILISIITSIFYGFFSLWLSSFVKDLENSGWVWTRVISPIYMFCGYFSTWESVFQTNNIIGYLQLLNPVLYAVEGMHAAFLGQNGYLNFWICLLMLMFFIFIFGYLGIKQFKKRVDFV